MKELVFYPGCALQSMSWDYRESIKDVASALDIHLLEAEEWTCCGATAAHSLDERMSILLSARNFAGAEQMGRDLVVACPMCYRRFAESRQKLREMRIEDPWSLKLDFAVYDLARMLATDSMLERIKENTRTSLDGLRVVCYYGCQVVRPPKLTGDPDYENPQHLDRIASATGAIPIDWSFKATCCGSSIGIPRKDIGLKLVGRLLGWAHAAGADAVIVCCPLCHSNLDLNQRELKRQHGWDWEVPILYYTELLAVAFGLGRVREGLKSHLIDPRPLLDRICLSREGGANV